MGRTSFGGNESLRPNNISHAVPSEKDSTRQLLLRIPRHITTHHCQRHTKPQPLEKTQPKRYQPSPFIAIR
jgi:hypothetical protein